MAQRLPIRVRRRSSAGDYSPADVSVMRDAVWREIRSIDLGPEIFNTDQGSQFTAADFINVLKQHQIRISMDARGAWRDNVFVEWLWRSVKCEEVHLHAYESVSAAKAGRQVPHVLQHAPSAHVP